MSVSAPKETKTAFDLKGSAFTILVLSLRNNDMDMVSSQLAEKVRHASDFFHNAPVVIDLRSFPESAFLDLAMLLGLLRVHGFIPVGLTGCTERQKEQATALELAVLTSRVGGKQSQEEEPEEEVRELRQLASSSRSELEAVQAANLVSAGERASLILTDPVRSGQRVVLGQGDIIVMASVGSGAELATPGNIHVYGTLRGRAFAGSTGDHSTRIFCQRLEAELVSIAGVHMVNEDFPAHLRSKAVHIQSVAGRLHITAL
jgi:septum site-determining protein MinC